MLLVTGPRQAGKSTLLESMMEPERKKVSLDNPTIRAMAISDPELFLQRYSPPVLVDEAQYAPELFPYIKTLADERRRPGDFWLIGSQMFRMMKNVTESLAGRVGIVPMQGLTNSEIRGQHFPTFEVNVENLLKRLETTQPMSVTEVFERIYKGAMPHLYEIEGVIKSPRMYFLDTGLCAHLMGWGSATALENSSMSGQLFETWVVAEIYKSYLNAGRRPPLYFYRDNNKKEIDLIISQDGTVYPIEIKKGSAPKDAIRNFSVLSPIEAEPSEEDSFSGTAHLKTKIGTGAVVCLASDIIPIDRKNWYIPAWLI